MNAAKQTAMDHYGLTEWPPSHMRNPPFADCRGMACYIMRREGMTLKKIAAAVGFADHKSVLDALERRKAVKIQRTVARLREMGHMAALVVCIKQLKGF